PSSRQARRSSGTLSPRECYPREQEGTGRPGRFMSDPVAESLIIDLLEWISNRTERTYEEVMDAWRTSCPRLPIWEDASDRGLVTTDRVAGRNRVKPTAGGMAEPVRAGRAER